MSTHGPITGDSCTERAEGLHDAALGYARRGWPVIPCHTGGNGRCTCGNPHCESPAKHPHTPNGLHDATTDPRVIDRWWLRWPDANVALVCGRGLVVLDIDGDQGRTSIAGKLLPITPLAATGRGMHYYYHSHLALRSRTGLLPGVDLRAAGAYVLAPPSLHPTGRHYAWLVPLEQELAPLPDWLVQAAHQPSRTVAPTQATLSELVREGRRDSTLASIAGALRRRGADRAMLLSVLSAINTERCRPPLPTETVERIALSISRYRPPSTRHYRGGV